MFEEQLKIALAEFWHVAWVLVLVIGVISIITGFVREYVPQEKLQKKLQNQKPVKGALMGAGLGVLTPFCSASMVPIARGMIEMSAPFSTVLPFLISAPLSNFVVVGIIFATFGLKTALIYFIWTFSCAIIAGLTVGFSSVKHHVKSLSQLSVNNSKTNATSSCGSIPVSFTQFDSSCSAAPPSCAPTTSSCCSPAPSNGGHAEKVRGALLFGKVLFKQIVPYVIIGAAISGIAVAFIPNTIIEKYLGDGSWYAIPIAAVIGVPLYLRIEMAIPILSALLAKGMAMGPAMALLIGGTGASLPEIAILSSMLKPKALIAFVLTVIVIAMLGGVLFMFV
ncbi:permease [Desulfosporosinus shakirovi]|uniref:permease n=1 Tax=Desulfosporosinus shakirovi TaxID=2885154 RepID=UPI001E45612E|nr:permease [Desulfosporosinus sp. SRJS8]MCB8816684.1 permease [Desulfosporosinus sp. SRJS8]